MQDNYTVHAIGTFVKMFSDLYVRLFSLSSCFSCSESRFLRNFKVASKIVAPDQKIWKKNHKDYSCSKLISAVMMTDGYLLAVQGM